MCKHIHTYTQKIIINKQQYTKICKDIHTYTNNTQNIRKINTKI